MRSHAIQTAVLLGVLLGFAPPAGTSIPPIHFPQGDGHIALHHVRLREDVIVRYRSGGRYLPSGLEGIRYLLRSRDTGETAEVSLKLIELIDHLQDHFGVETVHVISGYRSPQLNARMRRQGRRAAKYSRHLRGEAADIRLPGISPWRLRQYLVSLKAGGVGYYPGRRFVHVDVGPVRTW